MLKRMLMAAWMIGALIAASASASAEEKSGDLAKAMTGVKVTLQQGLAASQAQGKPISAKFEVEDGALQLSVYTAKDGKFSEVIVDHTTGKVAKVEAITEGEDLPNAKSQAAAMAKATKTLQDAADQAAHDNTGATVVSVTPKLDKGHAVAAVKLMLPKGSKTVSVPLE
jgi:hypothetical protein